MKIVYYFDNENLIAPVKNFLFKYAQGKNDSKSIVEKKLKVLAYIDQSIKFIAENNAKPIPPIAKTIKGYKFHEIRVKDGSNLIRIFYFGFHQKKMVLLFGIEKPERYDKGLKKKIDRKIKEAIKFADKYYRDFIKNQIYEEYK